MTDNTENQTTSYEDRKEKLKAEQDARILGQKSDKGYSLDEIIRDGAKSPKIKNAFIVEEEARKKVEKERDDNLDNYLEEREWRLKAQEEVQNLRAIIAKNDQDKAEAIDAIKRERDEQCTTSKMEKDLMLKSRDNFKNLLESRKGFRLNK